MVAQQKENIFNVLSGLENNVLSRKQLSPNEIRYLVDVAKDLRQEETLRIKAARTLTHASRNLQNLNNFAGDLLTVIRENSRVSPFALDLLRTVISRSTSRGFVMALLKSLRSTGLNTPSLLVLHNQLVKKLSELNSATGRYDYPIGSVNLDKEAEKALNAHERGTKIRLASTAARREAGRTGPSHLTIKRRAI